MALSYGDRCRRYAVQRGWAYNPRLLSISHLTPAQRRRALRKERHMWRAEATETFHA
jgi:hypothetical protein